MARSFLLLAALFGFLGVALGAFAAHGLRGQLGAEQLAVFQTGVHYQQWHALALLGLGLLLARAPSRLLAASGLLFALGILLFSGSLYALALSGIRALGAITPLGGLCFLGGWLLLGLGAWRQSAVARD